MAHCVFVHRADSPYDDFPEERYQFPKRYLKRARQCENDSIAYYEPRGGGGRLRYSAMAKVSHISEDPGQDGMFVAHIEPNSYSNLDQFVSFRLADGFVESELEKPDGTLNQGLIQWAIRPISTDDFTRLLQLGFPQSSQILPRDGDSAGFPSGFEEDAVEFFHKREPVEVLLSKIPRDRVFRRHVLEAYNDTCALTGLRLINGGGRAEVQAAHIRPVAEGGPDTVRNGIALSGTVHWMFDRGLISLDDDLNILISRHVNDPGQIRCLLNTSGKALQPANQAQKPHPKFLEWQRQHCFKR